MSGLVCDPLAVQCAAAVETVDKRSLPPFCVTVGHDQHEAVAVARVAVLELTMAAEMSDIPAADLPVDFMAFFA